VRIIRGPFQLPHEAEEIAVGAGTCSEIGTTLNGLSGSVAVAPAGRRGSAAPGQFFEPVEITQVHLHALLADRLRSMISSASLRVARSALSRLRSVSAARIALRGG